MVIIDNFENVNSEDILVVLFTKDFVLHKKLAKLVKFLVEVSILAYKQISWIVFQPVMNSLPVMNSWMMTLTWSVIFEFC